MKRIIYLLLISILTISCNSSKEDENENINTKYIFTFICVQEDISSIEIEILDENSNIISNQKHSNVAINKTIIYNFNKGYKLRLRVTDENAFNIIYTIKKDGILIYEETMFGYALNSTTKLL